MATTYSETSQSQPTPHALKPPIRAEKMTRPVVSGSWWWLATAGAAALAIGVVIVAVFWYLARPLALLILGISLAEALAPLVSFLERRIPRILAIVLVFLLLVIVALLIGWFVVPTLVGQAQSLVSQTPKLISEIQGLVRQVPWLNTGLIPNAATSTLGYLAGLLVRLPIAILASVFDLVVIVFIGIYWLVVSPSMHQFFLSLFPLERRENLDLLLEDMGSAMGGYIRGTAINGVIMAVLTYIGLSLIGVPYPSVLALLMGVMELIPVLGPIIAGAMSVAFALTTSPTQALITLAFIILLQQTEGHILVPNIMRSQANVSPLLAVLALLAGGTVGGLIGALVSIPLAGVITVFVHWVLAPAIRRQTGAAAIEVGAAPD